MSNRRNVVMYAGIRSISTDIISLHGRAAEWRNGPQRVRFRNVRNVEGVLE